MLEENFMKYNVNLQGTGAEELYLTRKVIQKLNWLWDDSARQVTVTGCIINQSNVTVEKKNKNLLSFYKLGNIKVNMAALQTKFLSKTAFTE